MAQQSKVKLTTSKLELEGVQVTFRVNIGDWTKYIAISPIDYEVFKRWDEIYAPMVINSICKDIEYAIKEEVDA